MNKFRKSIAWLAIISPVIFLVSFGLAINPVETAKILFGLLVICTFLLVVSWGIWTILDLDKDDL